MDRFCRKFEYMQKDEVRESIIQVAGDIFSRYGYKKTTMDDIAKASRKGKSSIYYYFRNKEDIFLAILEKEAYQLRSNIEKSLITKEDPREKLKAYIQVRMKGFENLINFYNAIKNEYLSQFEFIEHIREKYDKEEVEIVQAILEDGLKKKMFQIKDPYLAAVAIVTAMKGFEIPLFIMDNKMLPKESRLDNLLDILFYGIVQR